MHLCPRRGPLLAAAALALFALPSSPLRAQRPPAQPNAAEILHRMQRLRVLGSVLYIAAHPDDENTRLIAWLANGRKVRTGYLSLTRGDGGQNLIGPELGDALGIIRTQELLEARRIDGGEQFFTRAVDFGFSKSADESFAKWGKQEVLGDVVRVIRMFRPDIIITRFAPDRSAGHGHHEASAILAQEAFGLAGDPKAFPEQLQQGLEAWQPRRLFFNGSTWWRKDLADLAQGDPDWFSVDVGGYDPLLGLSYTELAGRSRSMHKSQGFGAAETRGESLEYLRFIKGDRPKTKDIFEGIDMTWGRLTGGVYVDKVLEQAIAAYDLQQPERSIPLLADALKAMRELRAEARAAECERLIAACSGLTLEAIGSRETMPVGDTISIEMALTNRSAAKAAVISGGKAAALEPNHTLRMPDRLGSDERPSQPYWLEQPHGALYRIADASDIGRPGDHAPRVACHLLFEDGGAEVRASVPVQYKWVDRVDGERIRPVYVTPVASVVPQAEVLIARGGPQSITVEVEALTDSLTGQLEATLPEGWATTRDLKPVRIARRNERQSFTFELMPSEHARAGAARFAFAGPKGRADRTLHEIDYPHIMPQVHYTPAEVKLVPLDVRVAARRVGYVKGAGDEVPQALEQLGVAVEAIDPASARPEDLRKCDAIVTGIRAYNATKGMDRLHPLLLDYVEEGGTLVVQYNTSPRFFSGASDFMIDPDRLGPYPFKITRDRVTVEEAPPTFLIPDHPLLRTPNRIAPEDFEGWVQERGLYFAGEVDPHYAAPIAWSDPGEQPLSGGLIACDHGKGRFIYTGISFFRQLPAGVPGAYRLFANLISPRNTRGE